MKIEYFGYFCEVVESQGISLAAQKMYISQQGLSKALNVIESELGTTLLNRNRNSGSVSLTAEGQIFYDYASLIHFLLEFALTDIARANISCFSVV